jgi:phosphoenolpyruvate-protein kinase (PTS system EI component)
MKNKTLMDVGVSEAQIFDVHIPMLQDPVLIDMAKELIRKKLCNTEWALEYAGNKVAATLASCPASIYVQRWKICGMCSGVVSVLQGRENIECLEFD